MFVAADCGAVLLLIFDCHQIVMLAIYCAAKLRIKLINHFRQSPRLKGNACLQQ